ncbi:putative oligodendrocyte transcription factor 3-like [Apostichopus japonicus]|uniref:Putative oligodendrocyte transcription factor 3-like n=1 Tax=Stichopus japonicus TaxID=307972 RepID=A0A2G8KBV9_STIJA|nr:putative oligodendrocyte transcription factor 3-like [Apostichopus japonicus]
MEFLQASSLELLQSNNSIITAAYAEATGSLDYQTNSSQLYPQTTSWSCERTETHHSQVHDNLFPSSHNSDTWSLGLISNGAENSIEEGTIYHSLELCNQSHEISIDRASGKRRADETDVNDDEFVDRLLDSSGRDFNASSPYSSTSEASDQTASTSSYSESVEYHTRSGVTRPYSKRRSSATKRNRINKRERERMHKLCDAFEKLREILPNRKTINGTEDNNKKMSKMGTLVMAQRYIQALQDMLDNAPPSTEPTPAYEDMRIQQSFLPLDYGYHNQ